MTDKKIFIEAAKRVSRGASDYSCLAVGDAETLAGYHDKVLRMWYSNVFSPNTLRQLITDDIVAAVDEGDYTIENGWKSVPQRKFRVLLLLMAAACVEDMIQVGGEWGECDERS